MKVITLGITVYIAFVYSVWPLLAKRFNLSGDLVNVMVCGMTFSIILLGALKEVRHCGSLSPVQWITILLLGVGNGVAVLLFGRFVARPDVPTGMFVAMVFGLVVVFTPIVDFLVTHYKPTWQQAVGILLLALSVVLIAAFPRTSQLHHPS